MSSPVSRTGSERSDTLADEKENENGRPIDEKDIEAEDFTDPRARTRSLRRPSDSTNLNASRSRSRHDERSLRLARSLCDGRGCECCDDKEDVSPQESDDSALAAEKAFEVKFEGSSDPMNPRNMPKVKRWIIVIVVSMSSSCV